MILGSICYRKVGELVSNRNNNSMSVYSQSPWALTKLVVCLHILIVVAWRRNEFFPMTHFLEDILPGQRSWQESYSSIEFLGLIVRPRGIVSVHIWSSSFLWLIGQFLTFRMNFCDECSGLRQLLALRYIVHCPRGLLCQSFCICCQLTPFDCALR